MVKLGRLHAMHFAGRPYVDTYGNPTTKDELLKHRFVLQVADQTAVREDYDRVFPGVPQVGFVSLRTNVSSAHYWSIAKGAGIGRLPTYADAIGARIIPIDIDAVSNFV